MMNSLVRRIFQHAQRLTIALDPQEHYLFENGVKLIGTGSIRTVSSYRARCKYRYSLFPTHVYANKFLRNHNKSDGKKCGDISFKTFYRNYSSEIEPEKRRKHYMKIVTIKTPSQWLREKLDLYKVRKYDPDFEIPDFLIGAKQAVCTVSQLLCHDNYDDLKGLVEYEVIQWLKAKIVRMTNDEKEVLYVEPEDIFGEKIRAFKVEESEEGSILYVDTTFFGHSKRGRGGTPLLLVQMGFRFKRQFSKVNNDISDWNICGVYHYGIIKLNPKKKQSNEEE